MTKHFMILLVAAVSCALTLAVSPGFAQESEKPDNSDQPTQKQEDAAKVPPIEVSVSGGHLNLKAPGTWKKKQPAVNLIESEFEIPNSEGDELPGRLTMMGAGGSVEANIDRWVGQFKQPDGSSTKDKTKIEKKKIDDHDVHVVTIQGIYLDGGMRPFGPKTERENYLMLAAIIETQDGLYFIKSYGGKKTMEANKTGFMKMIDSLKFTQ